MIVSAHEMIKKAKEGKYAICQFNINNLEWTRFILEECNTHKAPVILGVSTGAAKYMGGFKTVFNLVNNLISDLKITIPVCLHLDHGSSFEDCRDAIKAGFKSVMIDASKESIKNNIKITNKVCNFAGKSVSVEAEVGLVGGEEDDVVAEVMYASVSDCLEIKEMTSLDMLAPALGSVHGLYKSKPNLNFERMKEISELTDLPLVLHGGTGIPDSQVKKSIECGICKININTELQISWTKAVRNFLHYNTKIYDPRKVIKSGENALKDSVLHKLRLTNSINKA